ncbi:MAG: biotin transporter BioY [Clostridiales bacterium]|nr:biotin transporter BioY [Clostridiales bacterium]
MRTKLVANSALMCALLIISTLWIKFPIPGTSVLLTTQVLFILLCGQLLPPVACLVSVGGYLLLGLIGLPVFSATQGLAVIATPSFGFLLGFPFAAAGTAAIREKLKQVKGGRYWASLAGIVVLYAIAIPYIALLSIFYLRVFLSLSTLLHTYCLAFLPFDIIKGMLAAFLGERLMRARLL